VQLHNLRSHVSPLAEKVAQQHKSAVVSHSNFVVEHEHSHKSVYLGLLPYYGGEWKSNFLIDLYICVSCQLVAVHRNVTWEFVRNDTKVHIRLFSLYSNLQSLLWDNSNKKAYKPKPSSCRMEQNNFKTFSFDQQE